MESATPVSPVRHSRKGHSFFRFSFGLLVLFISILCLLCIAAAYINPAKFWGLALFGLIFHYIYPVNLALMLVSLLKRKKIFFLSFVPFIIGLPTIQGVFQFGFINNKKETSDSLSVKVISFNVRLFDLYNWSHSQETRNNIFRFLNEEQPDILCMQEFYSSDKKPMQNVDTLQALLKARNYQAEYAVTLRDFEHWGIATFSAFPVINKGVLYFGKHNGNVCIYTDVKVHEDTLRIFNTHLESIRFRREDYRFINNIDNSDEKDRLEGSKNILRRMKRAYKKRAEEVLMIDSLIHASPYKFILCGDFNDPPASFTYSVLSDERKDAFRESGSGFGETYRGPFPAYRIDYILHDKRIRSYNYHKFNKQLSDHFPISCEISLH